MRYGPPVWVTLDYSYLKPSAVDADPAGIELSLRDPRGEELETATYPGTIVRDSLGHFHWQSQPIEYERGGVVTVVARAEGFPEIRLEQSVEPSAW